MRHIVVLALLATATTTRADLLLTLEFRMTMTGNVPAQIPDAARKQESIVIVKLKDNKISVHGKPVNANFLAES